MLTWNISASNNMKSKLCLLFLCIVAGLRAQIPVTDLANLANHRIAHAESIVKWVDSINRLKTQITQLNQQIGIANDIREWAGDPKSAAQKLLIDGLGAQDLVRQYGRTKSAIQSTVKSFDSLANTAKGNFRALTDLDLDGRAIQRDELIFRRYAVLDATQNNTEQVAEETKEREAELQEEIAFTLDELKSAPTDAEVQKQAAKLTALNGQLAQVEAARRREVDAVTLQKIANDARLEQERLAAAELAAKDDSLANQRVSAFMKTIKVRQK